MTEESGPGPSDRKDDSDSDDTADGDVELVLKMVVLGDSDCGKTALCAKFARHTFASKYQPTAGVDFYSRRISFPSPTSVLIQLWDIGGQSMNSTSMLRTYVFGANAILFVYDVTNKQSFENVRDWIRAVKAVTAAATGPRMFLVGAKTDLEHRRTVTIERNMELAREFQLESLYVSSKTGDNVELMFKRISAQLAGFELSRAEKECNISVVQAPIGSSAAGERYRPVYAKQDDVPPPTSSYRGDGRRGVARKNSTMDAIETIAAAAEADAAATVAAASTPPPPPRPRPPANRGSVACAIS